MLPSPRNGIPPKDVYGFNVKVVAALAIVAIELRRRIEQNEREIFILRGAGQPSRAIAAMSIKLYRDLKEVATLMISFQCVLWAYSIVYRVNWIDSSGPE